jgi:calcium/calmodulin-dependent protein kinase I
MSLRHPNLIYLREYFEENNKVYIIMEYLRGGELLEAVIQKGHYSEDDARTVFKQLIAGVTYMHDDRSIVHRDLKLENLLLVNPGDISAIKIADFGLAKKYAGSVVLSTICGTPQYVAPEVIKGGRDPYTYGKECDLWSLGIILYILLGGYPPFWDESEPRLFAKIRGGKYDFNDKVWNEVSFDAKDLISKLLQVDPARRYTVEQVENHAWMRAGEGSSKRELLQTMSKMRASMRQRAALLPEGLDEE